MPHNGVNNYAKQGENVQEIEDLDLAISLEYLRADKEYWNNKPEFGNQEFNGDNNVFTRYRSDHHPPDIGVNYVGNRMRPNTPIDALTR